MERFDGKKVIECQVSDGISKADELVKNVLCHGDAPVYHSSNCRQARKHMLQRKSGGIGHKIIYTADERCISYASVSLSAEVF